MARIDHSAVSALMRDYDERTPADLALLRSAGLVHDYAYYDTPAQKTVRTPDSLTGEARTLRDAISDARRKEHDLRERLDAIAREMDRGWGETRSGAAPMSNVLTHPAWKQYSRELKAATTARMKAEAAASKRITGGARKQRHRYTPAP